MSKTLLSVAVFFLGFSTAHAWQIERLQGEVKIEGKAGASAAQEKAQLAQGSVVVTGKASKALLKDGESEVWVAPNSRFSIEKTANDDSLGMLRVLQGAIRAKFKRPSGPEEFPYKVKLKTIVAGVRGTIFFAAIDGNEEKVCTFEGLVRVSPVKSAGETWDVAAGRGLFVKPREMPRVRELTAQQKDQWLEATTF